MINNTCLRQLSIRSLKLSYVNPKELTEFLLVGIVWVSISNGYVYDLLKRSRFRQGKNTPPRHTLPKCIGKA
jgi:hypothetical protein